MELLSFCYTMHTRKEREPQACTRTEVCTIECVLLLQNVFPYYRMCSLTIEVFVTAGVYTYKIKVSLLEIYNETIRDLLEPKDAQTGIDNLKFT